MSLFRGVGRGRAFLRFLVAVAWWAAAYLLSATAAHGFVHGAAYPLLRNLFEIFLLIVGFSYMEMSWDGSRQPVRAMGLPRRPGAAREFALGAALGWGMVTVVLLIEALGGIFYIRIWNSSPAWESLVLQLAILATASLAAEIAFRGYPFQKLVQSTGPISATILAAIFFGLLRLEIPGSTPTALWVSGVAAVVLSFAYLRTGALWLCWGLHFSWLASIAILFGQPLAGNRHASSVIHTYIDGPAWLTGAEYGPEASLITLIVLWIGLYLLFRITRHLAAKYGPPQWRTPMVPVAVPLAVPVAAPLASAFPPAFPSAPPPAPPNPRSRPIGFPEQEAPAPPEIDSQIAPQTPTPISTVPLPGLPAPVSDPELPCPTPAEQSPVAPDGSPREAAPPRVN